MKRILLFLLLVLSGNIFFQEGFSAGGYPEVSCSSYGTKANSCDQCFDGGLVYNGYGRAPLYDDFLNTTNLKQIILASENTQPVLFENLQPSLTWTYSKNPLFHFSQTFSTPSATLIAKYPVLGGTTFYTFQPNTTTRYVETNTGDGFYLANVSSGANRSQPGFKLTYNVNYRTLLADGSLQNPVSHNECVFYKPAFCGDAILDPGKETCDPADSTKTGWGLGGCNTSCQPIPAASTPTCDSVYANPTSGISPLVSEITCSGSNLPTNSTYSVVCGNGTNAIMNGNKGSCTFTNNTTIAQAYTPICTINGTITSPACQTVVSVNPGVIPPVCNHAKSGVQPAPVLSTDTLCTVGTASGFTSVVSGTTTNYTWSCDTATSVACSASYSTTIPPTPGNFDLSIKKYAKSEDVFASVDNTENFNYTIVVRNNGTGAVTGTTTVRDILPAPITLRATPSGNDWTCTGVAGSADFTCTTNKSYPANTEFNVITIPVQVTGLVFRPSGYVNYAYVQNPQEADGKQCNMDNAMPNPVLGGSNGETPRVVCNEDANNFDPAIVNPPNPNGFDLRLKKFVNGDDESSRVSTGSTAVYTFTMQNLGALASSGTTTVTDTDFPAGITIASIVTTQGDWTCTQLSGTGFSCTMIRSLAAGEYASTISLTANIGATMVPGTYRNIACLSNPYDPNESSVLDPSTGKYKVNNCDPAEVVIVPAGTFDLSIKKYVADITTGTPQRDGDHQTTNDGTDVDRDILTISQGGSVRYRFVVRNEGPVTATGTTNVEDTLPNGFTITGSVIGTGWTCTQGTNGNRSFSCTRTENLAVGSSFPEIVVNAVSASAILAGEYSNTATVRNPGDTNPANNTDPANVEVIVGVPSCGTITGSNAGNVSPGTTVNYTCSSFGYTGTVTNLQYQINCGTGTGTWTTSNTGSCVAPTTSSTTMSVTCAVRDLTNPGILFSGSLINSCRTTVTTTGGGGGGPSHVGPSCVNSLKVCVLYNSLTACEQVAGVGNCDVADAPGQDRCATKTLVCSGGGGPTPGGPSNPYGRCGDGVLQAGEECDVVGAPWCLACKLDLWTNPGANPILDLWMTIPALSGTRFGSSPFMKTPFSSGVVIGVGTKVFTLADTVGFGIKTQYTIPLMIEAEKTVCLSGSGNIDNKIICTTFGEAAQIDSSITKFTRPTDGKKYVIIGRGDYQYQTSVGGVYTGRTSTSASDIDLFHGSVQYQPLGATSIGPTLNSVFQGTSVGRGDIGLVSCSGTDCSSTAIVSLPVRISGAIIGTTGTPVNRSIESFVKTTPASIVASFLSGISNSTTTSTTTNSSSNLGNIAVNGAAEGNISAARVDTIPALNGNQNIRAIKGNLIVNCPAVGSPFVMEGVRTVIVEGNITFNCNTTYTNANSSWAWIAKGGDIIVSNGDGTVTDKGITNLAGVYVTIPGTTGGRFVAKDARTTTAILKIDGSLYGNASPLFDSRLYARGTSAYDILTTGTIISYSNRALVNPPPLLSQYLNNYTVERVVK